MIYGVSVDCRTLSKIIFFVSHDFFKQINFIYPQKKKKNYDSQKQIRHLSPNFPERASKAHRSSLRPPDRDAQFVSSSFELSTRPSTEQPCWISSWSGSTQHETNHPEVKNCHPKQGTDGKVTSEPAASLMLTNRTDGTNWETRRKAELGTPDSTIGGSSEEPSEDDDDDRRWR